MRWVVLLAAVLLLALTHPHGAAAQQNDAAPASPPQWRGRVALGAGASTVLSNALEVTSPLVLSGVPGRPALINCSSTNGPHAFIVRGTTLELQHVIISGCSKQAIVLKGPGAVLKAANVTFRDLKQRQDAAADMQPALGLIISAVDARVELTDVLITENDGAHFIRSPNVPTWRPFLHPACKDASVSGGVTTWGANSSSARNENDSNSPACGSPMLGSSLIDLEQSTLVLRGGKLQDNMADALLTARGSSANSVQLLAGTQLSRNRARWLVVADSWVHDPLGRKHMKAPQPSDTVKGVDMEPPYTSYSLMGQLREESLQDELADPLADPDAGGRRRRKLHHQQQQQPAQQQTPQASPSPSPSPSASQQQAAQQAAQQQQLWEQQQQPMQPPTDPQQLQPPQMQSDAPQVSPDSVVGKAPKGQVPLQVRFQGVSISHNLVQSGLLWLRLVNTSMQDTAITYNIGTGGRNSIVRQLRLASGLDTAAADAQSLLEDVDPAAFAGMVAAAGSIVPPGPCDVGSLQRSLLIVHGPSAFDMHRSDISHNIHFSGAVMRVSEGMGPTSMRSSTFANNTATAVLRFEGRTWVFKTDVFFAGIQFLDVLFYTQFQGASQAAYKFAELQHAQQQASKDKVSYDAFWFMSNTSMVNNTVFHSLVMSKGSRTSWRAFLAQKADILQSGRADAAQRAKNLPLINLSTSWWMKDCLLEGNRLQLPPGSTTASSTSNAGPFSSRGGSPARPREGKRRQEAGGAGGAAAAAAAPALPPRSAADGGGSSAEVVLASNEWLQAVPYAAYSDVLSAVLDADEALLSKLSEGGNKCYDALRLAVDEQQAQLTLQVMLRATAPAVLWASTTQGFIENSDIIGNSGFFHTLRMDNAYITWHDVSLANNSAALSVFDLWFGDAWVNGARVLGNQVQGGSVLNFESFRGRFQQILLQDNKAGTARPSDIAGGLLPDDCQKKQQPAPKRPLRRGARGGSVATPGASIAGISSDASSSSSSSLSPIWRMSHFLGELHRASILNNTGSIALDISGMALAAPLTELLVAGNMASGIRLLLPEPKYDNQSIELYDVFVEHNSLSPAAPLVGGLLIGGFTSGVGATMPVSISNCAFVNNTPVQPADTLTLQGGGVCIQGPNADSSDDPMSQHGFLQKLSITMRNTRVWGNRAAEGGGLWTAWPMIIEECEFRDNYAVVSGGGIYAKGLQADSLGAFGALIINHTAIVNNTASFGGGIACDSCRAILAAQIDGNQAIRNVSFDEAIMAGDVPSPPPHGSGCAGANGGAGGGSSWGGNAAAAAAMGLSSANNPLRRLRHAVLGAGGGIAANLAGNSYVVVCTSGNSTNINDRGISTLRDNTAWALGGAVYLNASQIATDCPFPQPGPELTETCFPGGYWPTKCGFNTLDLNWQGSEANAGGDLVAWAGDVSGFNMACTLSGPALCDASNQTLRRAGNLTELSSSSGGNPSGVSVSVSGAGAKPKGSKKCRGWDCKKGGSGDGSHNSTGAGSQQTCVRSFNAQAPYVCSAGSGYGGRNVMLVNGTQKFQLPASFYVYNTTCLQEVTDNFTRSWQSCAVAGDLPHAIPRVFSGDTVNLTVSLGTTQERLSPQLERNESTVIGVVQLQTSLDGLFVIGDLRQQMRMGTALFDNMALQPVDPPISNREYEFKFLPAWGPGNDLLRQVQPVSVRVTLLRCTLGMHMTINRCVRCSANGTYSLNPFTNETIGCQPCPTGGLCQNGLLVPRSGYYSYNPFVPQILPCPLKGACVGGRRSGRGISPSALRELQRQILGVSSGANSGAAAAAGSQASNNRPAASSNWARYGPMEYGPDWGGNRRRLLQLLMGQAESPSGEGAPASAVRQRSLLQHSALLDAEQLLDGVADPAAEGGEGGHSSNAQYQELQVSRKQALLGYDKVLAQLWANDSTQGMPLLMGVDYSGLLDAWHRLQCNPGYTGLFCGRCDLNYVEGALLVDSNIGDVVTANDTHLHGERYGLYMGSCVPCKHPAVVSLSLFALFLLLFAYNAFGMCVQLRNSGIRDPYIRFVKALQAQQQRAQQQQGGISQQLQMQPSSSNNTNNTLPPSGSSTNLARASSSGSSQASGSQQHQSHYGSTSQLHGGGSSQQLQLQQPQQSSQLGQCYSVYSAASLQPVSYGFAVPFAAIGPPLATVASSATTAAAGPSPMRQGSVPSPLNPYYSSSGQQQQQQQPYQQQQQLARATTLPSPVLGYRQGSMGSPAQPLYHQGSVGCGGMLSPTPSMGSPFLQQSHLPPLPPTPSIYQQQQQQQRQASAASVTQPTQQQPQQQQLQHQASPRRVSWGASSSSNSGEAAAAAAVAAGAAVAAANSVQPQQRSATGSSTVALAVTPAGGDSASAAVPNASAAAPPAVTGAGSSFVFASPNQDQQQPRDQQAQQSQTSPTSPQQPGWWGGGPGNTSSGPVTMQQQQMLSPQQQQQQQQLSLPQHSASLYGPQQSMPTPGSMRHRYHSSALSSVPSARATSAGGASGRGGGGGGGLTGSNSRPSTSGGSSRAANAGGNSSQRQQQQQQQNNMRKGPAGLLVGLWKVLTSYLQVLGTVRHVSLRALPEMSTQALAFADLSSFTSFVALDCLLPGPQEWHAFIKLFARTIALPILLLIASALMWTACWLGRHLAVRLHRRYSNHGAAIRWQPLRQMSRQMATIPDPFRAYLSPRMLITLVVLSYSLYPLVTSGLLYTLQCVYIPGPFSGESAAIEYSRRHYEWLEQRAAAANRTAFTPAAAANSTTSTSSMAGGGVDAYSKSLQRDLQLCRPGEGSLDGKLCWVTGRYWAMDYDVQCFVGHHRAVAIFGLVMLLLVGVAFPVLAAVGLWKNRKRLDEWDFAWKWSFLYAEYKPSTCFWEMIIMGRKLAFLAATILLPMALDTPEETTAQMQLLVCVMLAVTFLLLHASLHPFKQSVLNRLERLGLTAIALSCTILAASLAVTKGRSALLALLAVVNIAVVLIFLYHIIKQLWLWVGAPAKKAVRRAYKHSRTWWAEHVYSRARPRVDSLVARCRQWPGALQQRWASLKSRGVDYLQRKRKAADEAAGADKPQEEQQQQAAAAAMNGHALPSQQQQANGHAPQGAAANGQQQQQKPLANGQLRQQQKRDKRRHKKGVQQQQQQQLTSSNSQPVNGQQDASAQPQASQQQQQQQHGAGNQQPQSSQPQQQQQQQQQATDQDSGSVQTQPPPSQPPPPSPEQQQGVGQQDSRQSPQHNIRQIHLR